MPPLPQRAPTAPSSNDVLTSGGQRASGGQEHDSDGLLLPPLVTLVAIHDLPAAAQRVRPETSSAGVVVSGADDATFRPD